MANIKFSALPAAATPTGTETTVGLQGGAAVQFSPYTTQAAGDASVNLATDGFVAGAIASVNPASAVNWATAAVLPNTPTYNNGTAGVGATLTSATNTALTVDGNSVALNDRVLVKNQVSTFQNGVYYQTQVGTGSVPWILTRATDYNTSQNVNYTGIVSVIGGTANANTDWLLVSFITAIGSGHAITYALQTVGPSSGSPGNVKSIGTLTPNAVVIGQGGTSEKTLASLGTSGQALLSAGASAPPAFGNIAATVNTQTSSYQLVLADANNIVNMQVTGAGTLTIPANASVAFAVGTIIDVLNTGTAADTIAITTDTLEIGVAGVLVTGSIILPIGGTISLLKTAPTTWLATGNQGAPARIFIGSQTVSGSSTSAVTFSSGIPSAYRNLMIRITGRVLDTTSTGGGNIFIQLNGDTTSGHYTSPQLLYGFGASAAAASSIAATANGIHIGCLPNSYNSSVQFGVAEIIVYNYNQTSVSIPMMGNSYANNTTGSSGLRRMVNGGTYTPSAVITQVTITAYQDNATSVSDFASGTIVELYAEL